MIFISPIIIDLMSYIVIRVYIQFTSRNTTYIYTQNLTAHDSYGTWTLEVWLAALHSTHSATEAQLIDNSWNFLSTLHCPQQAAPSILLPSMWALIGWSTGSILLPSMWTLIGWSTGCTFFNGRRQGPLGTRVHNYCKLNAWALPYRQIGDQCYQQDIASLSVSGNTSEPNMRLL